MTRAIAARALLAAATALAAALGLTAPASASPAGDPAPARGTVRVIVTYDSLASRGSVAGSVDRLGTVTRTMKRSAHLVARVPAADLDRLRRSPHVRSVQLDVPEKLTLDSSTHVIHADTAHAAGWTGAGTTVAILDTGVDVDHPFLGGRVIAQYCSSDPDPSQPSEQSLCPNGSTTDDSADIDSLPACASPFGTICDHGTHVAGIAAGNGSGVAGAPVAGVAPGANIIAMQVFTRFNDTGFCGLGNAPCVASYPSDQMAALDELAAARHRAPVVERRGRQPEPGWRGQHHVVRHRPPQGRRRQAPHPGRGHGDRGRQQRLRRTWSRPPAASRARSRSVRRTTTTASPPTATAASCSTCSPPASRSRRRCPTTPGTPTTARRWRPPT